MNGRNFIYLTVQKLGSISNLTREQVQALVLERVEIQAGIQAGAHADNAEALSFGAIKAWKIAALRRALAEMIVQ